MKLYCKVGDIETLVIGYGPGKTGPLAIVPWQNKNGDYVLKSVALDQCIITKIPEKLKRKLRKIHDLRHEKALKNTLEMSHTLEAAQNSDLENEVSH